MKRILFLLLVAVGVAAQGTNNDAVPIQACDHCFAYQSATMPQAQIMISGDQILEIRDKDGKLMVHIDLDGKVTYGEGYKPDDSAKLFWKVLGDAYPEMCIEYEKHKKDKPKD